MGPKTLFLVLLKALGAFLVASNVGILVRVLVNCLRQANGGSGILWGSQLQTGLPAMVVIAVGLYMFFGGRRIADLAIPSNRPRCDNCGYAISGGRTDRCPECGAPIRRD